MIGKRLLARWDVGPEEQAGLTFGQVLTLVNLRRIEIACLLGIFTRLAELATGYKPVVTPFEIPIMLVVMMGSLAVRRMSNQQVARVAIVATIISALLMSQWSVAVLGEKGRLTSGYPMMLLSLTLLFVVPPRFVIAPLAALLILYACIVLGTKTNNAEQIIAILNAALVTVICIVAAALIHSGRRRDYNQKREIRLQNARLVERNVEMDSLMAITAHDLRSPLYGLRNLIDLAIRRAPQEPGLPLVVLDQAKTSLDAMLSLATRMLDAHSAEHQPLDGLSSEDVRGHVLAAAERIEPRAQAEDIVVEVDLPDHPLAAILNAGALAQILDNLLSNGVRYTPTGRVLAIKAAREGPFAAIRVEDCGPGIDPAARNHLFKRFSPSAPGKADAMPSKGMGLFIVATLAERMDAIVSHEPLTGGGAAFVVRLKLRRQGQGSDVKA
jgi:signal transduction histidine kinase